MKTSLSEDVVVLARWAVCSDSFIKERTLSLWLELKLSARLLLEHDL